MEWIYAGFVIFLFVLAISDLWVGVSNDAVNFLNSAIGSKAIKFRTAITVAAIGVFCGAVMSNGMMDIARHGIFRPEYFSFEELMFVFLAVMVTDIILLDAFNSLGMPTSTTVSMVFELLGATFAFSLLKINDSGLGFAEYMNTSKALSVIIGIFISVAIAFTVGVIVQWISRLIFTFRYSKGLKWKIGLFGGIAITSIIYFMLLKGIKTMSFMTPEIKGWISDNTLLILTSCFVFFTILTHILYLCKVNVFKIIVILGTFSLATAFAGNDLVNFIGVPLSGFSAWQDWQAAGAGDPAAHMMGALNEPASTPFIFLFAAGAIMVTVLATSKKAHNVTKTEINLAKQEEGEEMFGTSRVARSLVRFGNRTARTVLRITPVKVQEWVGKRFDNSVIEMEDGAAYDLVRASVNLVTASLLIALGTSLKLPLSTTYVTFMVAMGTSLVDKAWSRESAVYRITGVLSVIGGWFLTAGIAFACSFIIALIMHWGGITAAAILVVAGLAALIHSNLKYKEKEEESSAGNKLFKNILNEENPKVADRMICEYISLNESETLNSLSAQYKKITDGLADEDAKTLRKCYYNLRDEKSRIKALRKKQTICLRRMEKDTSLQKSAWFYALFNDLEQIYYTLRRICEPAYEHVDNNFTPLSPEYAAEFIPQRDLLIANMEKISILCSEGRYEELRSIEQPLEENREAFSKLRKSLVEDIQNKDINIDVGYLYLNLLQESEHITISLNELIRSSRKFQIG